MLTCFWPLIFAVIGQQQRDQAEAGPGHTWCPHTLTPFSTNTHTHKHTAGPSPPNKTSSSVAQWTLSWKPIIFTGSRLNGDGEEEEEGGGREEGRTWGRGQLKIGSECCCLEFYQRSLAPKRSSDITADEFKNTLSRTFICNFQFSQVEPLMAALSDNRLQPVSAITQPVTNIKQLLQPEKNF